MKVKTAKFIATATQSIGSIGIVGICSSPVTGNSAGSIFLRGIIQIV